MRALVAAWACFVCSQTWAAAESPAWAVIFGLAAAVLFVIAWRSHL